MNRVSLFLVLSALSFVFAQEGGIKFQIPTAIVIEVKTNPEAAAIYLNNEQIGISPFEYKAAQPGNAVISIKKENYEPWDTTLTLNPLHKLKIDVALREKSIFSKEGELDLPKLIAKDTTVEGYRQRVGRVQARIRQIDSEINAILANFGDSYPVLEPQRHGESEQDFASRKTSWQNEGMRQMEALQKKHEAYKNSLLQSIKILEDNIAEAETLKGNKAKEAASAVAKSADASEDSGGGGLGWRGWTRILTFTAAAGLGAVAVVKHLAAQKNRDEISRINGLKPIASNEYAEWYETYGAAYNSNKDDAKENDLHRNIFGAGAGVFVVAGTLTFFF